MKKLLSIILIAIMVFAVCTVSSAQVLESQYWGIKFTMSDDWVPLYDSTDTLHYVHKSDANEEVYILYVPLSFEAGVRDIQTSLDSDLDNWFSGNTLAGDRVYSDGTRPTVTENYQNRRFETYNGVEYYRGEKSYRASAANHATTDFYDTYFFTVRNKKLFMISYSCASSYATHFADVTDMLNSFAYANPDGSFTKVGEVIGSALKTDIVATINGHHIPSYNVEGRTYIVAEDLRYYGFSVNYDHNARSLSITRDSSQSWVSKSYTKPYVDPGEVGIKEHDLLYTDIVTYLDGVVTPSYNINGQTIIRFNSLSVYGTIGYDNSVRQASLALPGIN